MDPSSRPGEQVSRVVFEHSPDAIFIEDLDGYVLDVNPAACALHEMTREELIGKHVLELVPPDHRARAEREQEQLVNGQWRQFEGLSWTKSGRALPVEIRISRIEHAGKPALLLHVRDLSDLRRAERVLRSVAEGTAGATGEEFFGSLVRQLAATFGVRSAAVCEHLDSPVTRVRTLAYWTGQRLERQVEYDLWGTPCAEAAAGHVTFYPDRVRELFPHDRVLVELEARSYCGMPLAAASGRVLGHLAIVDSKPMTANLCELPALRIFAARAAGELERQLAESDLRRSEAHYRQAAEFNRRLLHEVNHRVRNNLASLAGLVNLAQRTAPDVSVFAAAIQERIVVLTRLHAVLAESNWGDLELGQLIQKMIESMAGLAPHAIPVHCVGPTVWISPQQAVPIALTISELLTNSCKHGAHRAETGRLSIQWSCQPVPGGQKVTLRWREIGGPPIESPIKSSLGQALIHGFVNYELGGRCELGYPRQGVDHLVEFVARPSHVQ